MANMPEMGLEIFNAGGGWRDQKWAPSWSVKLPSLRQGRVQTLPCSLGRQSARSSSLERGKPRLSALKRRFSVTVGACLSGQPDRPRAAPHPPAPGTPTASSPPSPRAGLTILAEMTLDVASAPDGVRCHANVNRLASVNRMLATSCTSTAVTPDTQY
ncbi:hypothetical protein T09_4588 [Trichinella sp. T9]|nr:hypothetical protein T09_4588 [Trichinella sp. T9]